MFSIEVDGLDELIADMKEIPAKAQKGAREVVSRGALNIKRDAAKRVRAGLSGKSHLKHYPRSISYDKTNDGMTAEIGPDKGMLQGAFGRGIEFGSARAAPISHMLPAADEEEPRFFEAMGKIADGLL